MVTTYPIPGKVFTDPQGRRLTVDSVDNTSIVLRMGNNKNVIVISRRSWNGMSLIELRRAS